MDQIRNEIIAEMNKPDPDRSKVVQLLKDLEEAKSCDTIPVSVVSRLVDFDTGHKARKKPNVGKRILRSAVAAVLVVAILGVVPSAFGLENGFEIVGRWTQKLFAVDRIDGVPGYQTDHPGLQQVYDEVAKLNIGENVVPSWIPEGYELSFLDRSDGPDGISVYAQFANGADLIVVSFKAGSRLMITEHQKNEEDVTVVEYNGNDVYFVENTENISDFWWINGVNCAIVTNSQETVSRMVDSVYRRIKS